MTVEEMTAQREALLAARFRGVRTVEIDGRRITYANRASRKPTDGRNLTGTWPRQIRSCRPGPPVWLR